MIGKPSTIDVRVRYAETDQMGVVYHTNYLVWCEIGRTEHIATLGVRYSQLEAQGVRLAVAEAGIRFHAAARYDDLIRVETSLVEVKSRTMRFDYLITNAATGRRLVSANTTLVSLAPDGRTVALPQALRDRLEGRT